MSKKIARALVIFVLLMTVACGPIAVTNQTTTNPVVTQTATVTRTVTSSAAGTLSPGSSIEDLETTLESVYANTNPSVVYIEESSQLSLASGSGFVWDNNGNIVTNNHVVEGADRISVVLSDGTTLTASIVGQDADSDLAVIKVNAEASLLHPVSLGDSTALKVGQLVAAIGNPYGLQGTLTVGYISSLGRLLPTNSTTTAPSYSIPDVIQTDAAVNPGNSGGVLVDTFGKVIGVTSSIISESGSSAGIGFAIPSAIVQQVVPALISSGRYDHPYLGISVMSLSPDIAQAMNLPADQRGALVQTVVVGGPADKAGLRASQSSTTINGQSVPVGGDVIISYGDQKINSSDDLITYLARSGSVGETITLTILRNGQQMPLQVTLGSRPQ